MLCTCTENNKKAIKGILVGYDNNDGYRIWCRERNTLIRSKDVVFQEKTLREVASEDSPRSSELFLPDFQEEQNDERNVSGDEEYVELER